MCKKQSKPKNRELPIDMTNMPNMEELLGENCRDFNSDPVSVDQFSADDPRKNQAFKAVATSDMPTMANLLAKNAPIDPGLNKDESSILKSGIDERRKKKSEFSRTPNVNDLKNMPIIIDGSNVCRSYLKLDYNSSLKPLLTLTITLAKVKARFQCIFDANERYVLKKNSSEPGSEQIYENMLRSLPRFFQEVPGATNADDYILEKADRDHLYIISNDRFNKLDEHHQSQYPWLLYGTKRIITGNFEDHRLIIDRLGINIPLVTNLHQKFDELIDLLR